MTTEEFFDQYLIRSLNISIILIVSIIAWFTLRYFTRFISKTMKKIDGVEDSEQDQRIHTVIRFVRSIGYASILISSGMAILSEMDIDIVPYLASAGVAGIAIGFGAQTLVEDLLSGFFIIVEGQFSVGDDVIIDDVEGIVERIGFRLTEIRDDDGILHVIPNGEIRVVANQSKHWSNARVDFIIPYEEDVQHVKNVLKVGLDKLREERGEALDMLEPFEITGPKSIDERGVRLRILGKVEPGHQGRLQRVLRQYILELFRENNISMAVPRREIVMVNLTDKQQPIA